MKMQNSEFVVSDSMLQLVGVTTIFISIITWLIDISGMTYACPYCRTERSIIGLLGIVLLMLPHLDVLFTRFMTTVLGAYGFVVAAMQHFMGWDMIFESTYVFGNGGPWFFDEMLLSAGAMFIITAQIFIVFCAPNKQ